ncbi:MAG: CoB--CoM heterodisulfide reductase iron-sulfur subunit B family protein [bacterium]|nr:CoB--CoM heterodisulfide reductase iron-sulfur subunit B family protein [bacterium]
MDFGFALTMRYAYYPGCSLSATAKAYDISSKVVSKELGIEFEELEDWNCCGATAYLSVTELLSFTFSARNLALAEKMGLDIVAPCSSCFTILNKTNLYLAEYPDLKRKVDIALAEGGLKYSGNVKVRHLLDVYVNDIGYQKIKSKMKRDLKGLNVACYYGCQIVRPKNNFDDPEMPTSLDELVTTLGATPVHYPVKTKCCGSSLMGTKEELALQLVNNLLMCAVDNQADCIVTTCPLCQINLDAFQGKVNRKFKTNYAIPTLFFPQLVGLTLPIPVDDLAIHKGIVSAVNVLEKLKI